MPPIGQAGQHAQAMGAQIEQKYAGSHDLSNFAKQSALTSWFALKGMGALLSGAFDIATWAANKSLQPLLGSDAADPFYFNWAKGNSLYLPDNYKQSGEIIADQLGTEPTGEVEKAFWLSFYDDPLPREFLRHYMEGQGKPLVLSEPQMKASNPTANITHSKAFQGKLAHLQEKVKHSSRSSASDSIDVTQLAVAQTNGTMGGFTVHYTGALAVHQGGGWQFQGTMDFRDTWDFDPRTFADPKSGRSAVGELKTRAGAYMQGHPFPVVSVAVPVLQSDTDAGVRWRGEEFTPHQVVDPLTSDRLPQDWKNAPKAVGRLERRIGTATGDWMGEKGRQLQTWGERKALPWAQQKIAALQMIGTRDVQEGGKQDGDLTGPFYPETWASQGKPVLRDPKQALTDQHAAVYVNGVMTNLATHRRAAQELAGQLGKPVVGVFNATGGGARDLAQSLTDKIGIGGLWRRNKATVTLVDLIKEFGDPKDPRGGLDLYGHSQGSIIVSEALRVARNEGADLGKFDVTTFGNAAWTMPTGVRSTQNYVFDSDVVPATMGSSSHVGQFIEKRLGWLLPRIGQRSTADDTYMLHHSGAFDRPHGVVPDQLDDAQGNKPSGELGEPMVDNQPSYISELMNFKAKRDTYQAATQQMTPAQAHTTLKRENAALQQRSWASTKFAMARGVGSKAATTAASGYGKFDQWMRGMPSLPGLASNSLWNSMDAGLRGVGRAAMRGGAAYGALKDADFQQAAAVQRSGRGDHPEMNPVLLRDQLMAQGGMGMTPGSTVLQPMEQMLGADLSTARIHAGPEAAGAARALNAEAFTIGQDIFFGENQYDPITPQGQGLLAHELTHVIQQTGPGNHGPLRFATPEGGDAMEAEAQQARRMVMATRLGDRRGLFVEDYVRNYEAEAGNGLSEADIERLNRISLEALELAEQLQRREGRTLPERIDTLAVEVSLDFETMTDEQAIRLWASAICARLRSNARQPQGMAQSPQRAQHTQSPAAPASPMLAKSPTRLQRAELAKEAEDPKVEEALKEIEGYVGLWWVSPIVEWKLEGLWNSIDDLPGLIRRNPKAKDLFIRSIDKGAELDNIKQAAPLLSEFKTAVKQVALDYMMRNYATVTKEMERLGIAPGFESDGRAAQQRADEHIKIVQTMAAQVAQLQGMQTQLKDIYVGSDWQVSSLGHGEVSTRKVNTKFDPDRAPEMPAEPGSDQVPYAQVKGQWDLLAQGISTVANNNPGIYAMVRNEKVSEVANGSVYQAREALRSAFAEVIENINDAEFKIATDRLDHRELLPIHQQLFTNRVKGGGDPQYNWSDPYRQAVGTGIVADYQDTEFWKSLGLASLSAALFIVAEVASGGLATAALIGAGGISLTQVGGSLSNYLDMAGAAKTGVSDDTAIVEQRQVDSAKLDLIMNTVGAFLDWAGPAAKLVKGVRMASVVNAAAAGAREELIHGLGKLATLSAEDLGKAETRQLIEQSIRELGVEQVLARTGMNQEKLASALGKESDLGKRVLAFARDTGGLENLAKVKAGTLAREEAEKLIQQAVDQLGSAEAVKRAGGWKKLSTLLGNDSTAGKQLIAWRQTLYDDLEKFIGAQNIKRTGSASKFTNDMDISLLGTEANTDVLRARQYLATRAGVSPTEVEDLLYASFFSDPRRMHLYATLSPELASRMTTKRAAFETELIWSRRISLAEGPMRQSLIEQAERLGINWTHFRDLTVKDLQMLKRDVDDLYKAMEAASDIAEKTKLIDAIAEKQALINATEGGGYFSGGGVQRWVSERDKFPGYEPDDPKAWTAGHSAGNVMDQFAKLDEELIKLQKLLAEAPDSVRDVAGTLKSIGKYGERLTFGAKSALGVELSTSSLDESAEFFARLMADEKSGALLASRLATSEKIMQEMMAAERAVYRVQEASDQLLMVLMQRANLAGVKGDFKTIQAATKNQLLLRQITTGAVEHVHTNGGRALNALTQGQSRAEGSAE